MNIEDIMSKDLIVAKYSDSIKRISELMKQYDIGFIPISKDGKIIGVITDRDIITRAISSAAKGSAKVEDYISPNIISCEKNLKIDDVLKCMTESKIKRVIITDNKKIVGIISISDIMNKKDCYDTLKSIYEINKNDDKHDTEIDEFYL